MKNTAKRAVILILLLGMLLPVLSGCGQKTKEQIFTKTVHDFEGHLIANLDEQENTNFAVYAKGVERIDADGKANTVVSVDEENCVYTFSGATDSLKSLQPGQVFFVEASADNPTGAAGKVKEIKADGSNVLVYCDPVAMADLYAYVDIDMDLDLSQVSYDASGLEEGVEIEVVPTGNSNAEATYGVVPLAGDFNWNGSKDVELVVKYGTELAIGKSKNGVGATGHFKTENSLTVKAVRAQLYYDSESGFFSMDVSADVEESTVNSVDFEGSWSNGRGGMGHTWPRVGFFIPGTPIAVGVEEYLLITLSGGMKGSYEHSSRATIGLTDKIQDLRKVSPESYFRDNGKRSTAKLELEGKLEIMFGVRVDVGIPFVIDVFLEGGVGARTKGSLAMLEYESDYLTSDSIHDCDKCLDGDVELVTQCNWGIDARLLSTITGYDLVLRNTLTENTWKIGDFYASYREDAENGVECGWGECPYLRWKCTVSVTTEENDPAQYAYVHASYPDGREDKRMTDEDGVAVFYLPNGDNLLKCSFRGQRGSANAMVNGCPTTAKISLEDKQQLFVVYNFYNTDTGIYLPGFHFTELYQILQTNYPDAIYIPQSEWNSNIRNPQPNYTVEGLDEAYGVSAGDVILGVSGSKWQGDMDDGYHVVIYSVGVCLLPQTQQEEEEIAEADGASSEAPVVNEDIPYTIGVYNTGGYAWFDSEYDKSSREYYVVRGYYEWDENIWQGLKFDKNYRIEQIGTNWSRTEWEDPAPGAGWTRDYYWTHYAVHMQNYANYVYRCFPYIEVLMNNKWDEFTENQTGGSEVGIEIPQS